MERIIKHFTYLVKKEGEIVAYTRLFKAGDYFDNASIGRVAVKQIHRSFGYGHQIIKESINAIYNNFGIPILRFPHRSTSNLL